MTPPHRRLGWLLLLAPALGGANPEARRIDPPAGPGALGPHLTTTKGRVLLSWIEPTPGRASEHRVRVASLDPKGWGTPTTVTQGDDLFVNWADTPSVTAAGDGSLIAHWPRKSGPSTYAYDVHVGRSTDGGRSWQALGAAHDDGTQTEHGFVSVLPEGEGARLFWLDGRETSKQGAMGLRTAALGASMGPSHVLDERVCDCCGTAAAVTSEGPVAIYRDRRDGEIRDISIVRRIGGRWTQPAPVAADGWKIPGCPVNGPSVAAAGRRLAVAWFTGAGDTPSVRVARSSDAGASFAPATELEGAAAVGRVAVALDAGGDALVAWLARIGGADSDRAEVRAARVTSDGRRGPPRAVLTTTAGRAAGFPRMVRHGADLVFAWTETTSPTRVRAAVLPVTAIPPPTSAQAERAPVVGDGRAEARRPTLSVRTLDGAPVTLASLRGRPVLVNLWASWCEPCQAEVPTLAKLHRRGLQVVGISVDPKAETARRTVTSERMPYAVWHDPGNRSSAVCLLDQIRYSTHVPIGSTRTSAPSDSSQRNIL